MMTKGYKPERPVTSAKIRDMIDEKWRQKRSERYVGVNNWIRKFKRRLPESRGWVRGYSSGRDLFAVAISDETDTKLEKVYICDGTADEECKKLGVLEVMFADD